MDVVILFNGLGNQMSQYAFYLEKKKISKNTRFIFSKKSEKIHNGFELNRVFGIEYHYTAVDRILYSLFKMLSYKKYRIVSAPFICLFNLFGIKIIYENDNYNFNNDYLVPSKGIKFYVGGWHSEKYFLEIKQKILETFQFKFERVGFDNLELMQQLQNTTSISVHIRRGDFMDKNNYNKFGAVCTLNYFLVAIEKMKTLVKKPHFYFFTNDNEWVGNNFSNQSFTVVNINTGENSWKDMYLISNCTHHITSNGSFSWWSAYLDKNKDKIVIVPKNFMVDKHFEDIYPQGWIQLADY